MDLFKFYGILSVHARTHYVLYHTIIIFSLLLFIYFWSIIILRSVLSSSNSPTQNGCLNNKRQNVPPHFVLSEVSQLPLYLPACLYVLHELPFIIFSSHLSSLSFKLLRFEVRADEGWRRELTVPVNTAVQEDAS
jgi:hypothetical protein